MDSSKHDDCSKIEVSSLTFTLKLLKEEVFLWIFFRFVRHKTPWFDQRNHKDAWKGTSSTNIFKKNAKSDSTKDCFVKFFALNHFCHFRDSLTQKWCLTVIL